jgi:hypothetical protein
MHIHDLIYRVSVPDTVTGILIWLKLNTHHRCWHWIQYSHLLICSYHSHWTCFLIVCFLLQSVVEEPLFIRHLIGLNGREIFVVMVIFS